MASAKDQTRAVVLRLQQLVGDLLDLDAIFASRRSVMLRGRSRVPLIDFETSARGRLLAAGYSDFVIESPPARAGGFGDRVLLSVNVEPVRAGFPWVAAGLFPLALASMTLMLGATFAVTFAGILLVHEFGHFFAARRHGMDVSWPYFIPAPFFFFGTLGAFIRVRSAIRDRIALFDMAVAGPLAGFVVALTALFVGLPLSTVVNPSDAVEGIHLGDSLIFKAIGAIVLPNYSPEQDVLLHPIAFAGWAGLLVTMLNLLPMGQLDGGHIAYAMFGRYQRVIASVVLLGLAVASFWWLGWLLWVVIGIMLRPNHPPTVIDEIPLTPRRRIVGWVAFAVFVLTFIPVPFVL
ncbi:MAG: site-2 protease family protein [Candidatus Zixiibacteriota bacterium]